MQHIRILLVEDNPDDRLLIKRGLNKGLNTPEIIEVHQIDKLDKTIEAGFFDIVITDYNLGWTNGIDVLKSVKSKWPDCPVIMMTVMDTEEMAINAMKAGLDSYLVKSSSQFALMGEYVRSTLAQMEQAEALEEAESRFQELFETVPVGLFRVTHNGTHQDVNQTLVDMLNYPDKETLLKVNSLDLYQNPNTRVENYRIMNQKNAVWVWEAVLKKYDGSLITTIISAHAIKDNKNNTFFYEGYIQDISVQREVEQALVASEILKSTIIDSVQNGVMVTDRDLKIMVWNPYLEELSGISENEILGSSAEQVISNVLGDTVQQGLPQALRGLTVTSPDAEFYFPRSNKSGWVSITLAPLQSKEDGVVGVVANIQNITERKQAETERETLLKREQKLHEITRSISNSLGVDNVIDTTNHLATELFGADFSAIMVIDQKTKEMQNLVYFNAPEDAPTETTPGQGLMWDVYESKAPILLEDYATYKNISNYWVEYGIKAAMAIPLKSTDVFLGVMGIFSKDTHKKFTPRDLNLAISIGNQASVALHKAILYEETLRRTKELSALYDFSLTAGGMLDTPSVLSHLYQKIEQLINPHKFAVYLYDDEEDCIEVALSYLNGEHQFSQVGTIAPTNTNILMHEVVQTHHSFYIPDVTAHQDRAQVVQADSDVKSLYLLPFIKGESLLGAMILQSQQKNDFQAEDQQFLESIAAQVSIALDNARLYEELEDAFVQTVIALANAVDIRDTYTHDHSQRIAVLALKTGKELGFNTKELEVLRWSSLLHDIGKIGVPDNILLKPGRLTPEEYEIIKKHPQLGASIIAPVKKLRDVAPVVRAHQEHYDGSGYPAGLKGEDIPLAARVLTVVDSYVAMTDDRVYRKAFSHEHAIGELQKLAGAQFDPVVVEAFLRVSENGGLFEEVGL